MLLKDELLTEGIDVAAAPALLDLICQLRMRRLEMTLASIERFMEYTPQERLRVQKWQNVHIAMVIVESQMRMLLADARAQDINGEATAPWPLFESRPLHVAEQVFVREGRKCDAMSGSGLEAALLEYMRKWDSRTSDPTRIWLAASLLVVAHPLSKELHDVSALFGEIGPTPIFLQLLDRSSTICAAGAILINTLGDLPQAAAPDTTEALGLAMLAFHARFDHTKASGLLLAAAGETCVLTEGLSPLDPHLAVLLHNDCQPCPEEHKALIASWVYRLCHPGKVQAMHAACEDAIRHPESILVLFDYNIKQAVSQSWFDQSFLSDRDPLLALRRLREYLRCDKRDPVPFVVRVGGAYSIVTKHTITHVSSSAEALGLWARVVLDSHDGLLGRKRNATATLTYMLSPPPAAVDHADHNKTLGKIWEHAPRERGGLGLTVKLNIA